MSDASQNKFSATPSANSPAAVHMQQAFDREDDIGSADFFTARLQVSDSADSQTPAPESTVSPEKLQGFRQDASAPESSTPAPSTPRGPGPR